MLRRIKKAIRHPLWALRKIAHMVFKESIPGECLICGKQTAFYRAGNRPSETYSCRGCKAISRNRHIALVLCRLMGMHEPFLLSKLVENHPDLTVYEAQAKGAIHDVMQALPGYVCSEFYENVPLGAHSKDGIRCENLENLTFEDNSFDVVITQAVFEHIREPDAAWREVHRVLKPGGYHIFTIPYYRDRKTTRRVITSAEGDQYVLPKVFHGDGIRDGLVYTDFGYDLPDYLTNLGLPTTIDAAEGLNCAPHHIHAGWVFVSRKRS